MQIAPFVVGFAGHTRHGKTSIIRLLTGQNTMRLPEEQERGISIDMGFANFKLSDGRRVGIIDVPGHEEYFNNMVAGITGADIVVMVVAADDGVMNQTRQHLDALQLLGKKHGFTVITKTDTVEKELVSLARAEVEELVRGTFLEDAPVVEMSTVTRDGFRDFWAALLDTIEKATPKSGTGLFKMNIQRVFTREGLGLVVTGIPFSGSVKRGDMIEILPSGIRGTVKGIQAYNRDIEEGKAGHSVALNIAGAARTGVFRGDVAATPGFLSASRFYSVRITTLKISSELISGDQLQMLIGTTGIPCRINLLHDNTLAPTSSGFAQIILEKEFAAAIGETFLLVRSEQKNIVAGGVVLRTDIAKIRKGSPDDLDDLMGRSACIGNPELLIEHVLKTANAPLDVKKIPSYSVTTVLETVAVLASLAKSGKIVVDGAGRFAIHADVLKTWEKRVFEIVRVYSSEFPLELGIPLPNLRLQLQKSRLNPDPILDALKAEGKITCLAGRVGIYGEQKQIPPESEKKAMEIEGTVMNAGFRGVREKPLLADSCCDPQIIKYLVNIGKIARSFGPSGEAHYFHADIIAQAREKIISICKTNGGVKFVDLKEPFDIPWGSAVAIVTYFRDSKLLRKLNNLDVLSSP